MSAQFLFSQLTERQQQVGFCLLAGLSAKNIADQLGLSVNTVRGHQKFIKKKLFCKNSYQVGYQLGSFLWDAQKFSKYFEKITHFEGDQPHFWL